MSFGIWDWLLGSKHVIVWLAVGLAFVLLMLPKYVSDFEWKYYSEKNRHFDARYYRDIVHTNGTYRKYQQQLMFESFDRFCRANNIEYWLAHGTLLGWYWGEKPLEWDDDIDVQTNLQGMNKFMSFQSVVYDKRYLIDINPNFKDRRLRGRNKIDGRYIDTHNGVFIDITALVAIGKNSSTVRCKSPHFYDIKDIYPLQDIVFSGVKTFGPRNIDTVLTSEYSKKSLTNDVFNGYRYNYTSKIWELLPKSTTTTLTPSTRYLKRESHLHSDDNNKSNLKS